MEVSVEQTDGLERRVRVAVPAERVDDEVENRLRDMGRRVRIDGFRPGKVPFKILRQKYGAQVRREVLGEVMQSSFYEAVNQQNLRPAGGPRIEPQQVEPGQRLEYIATFEIYPEVTVQGIDNLQVERPRAEVSDADIDRVIENLRRQSAAWEAVDRTAQEGDRVIVDVWGTVEGEPFKGNEASDAPVTIGAGTSLQEFEDGVRGARAGDVRDVQVAFSEEHGHDALAGKTADFRLTVKSVTEEVLPPVDENLAQRFGITEGGVDAFRREVRASMERELEQAVKSQVKKQVLDQLMAANTIDVPRTLVDKEIQRLREHGSGQNAAAAQSLPDEHFEDQARRRVTLGILISEIVRANELTVDDAQVRALVNQIASSYEEPEQVVRWYYGNQEALGEIEAVVLEEKVVEWLLERATVTDKPMSFQEVVYPQAAQETPVAGQEGSSNE